MEIKLNSHCENFIIKKILDNIVTENPINIILLSDICNYVISNMIFSLIPTLKNLIDNKILFNKNFIRKELEETIKILENLKKNEKNLTFGRKRKEKNVKHFSPKNQKLDNKIYGDENDDDNKMFYQNSEEINNSDDIDEFDNNLNFEEMDNLFRREEQNIHKYKINETKKNNNTLKIKTMIK